MCGFVKMDSDDETAGAAAMLMRNVLEKPRKRKVSGQNLGWQISWSLECIMHWSQIVILG
jgi:hypothetical protein